MDKKSWSIEFINDTALKEFLDLDIKLRAKFEHISNLLEKFGPFETPMPYVRPLRHKLWEIRLSASGNIARSLFSVMKERRIIVLHSFVKKTQKTPKNALEKAMKRLQEL